MLGFVCVSAAQQVILCEFGTRRRGGSSVGAKVVQFRADSGADEDCDPGHHEGADDARATVVVPRDARGQVRQARGGAAVNKLEITTQRCQSVSFCVAGNKMESKTAISGCHLPDRCVLCTKRGHLLLTWPVNRRPVFNLSELLCVPSPRHLCPSWTLQIVLL
jgi:hypothetical protein